MHGSGTASASSRPHTPSPYGTPLQGSLRVSKQLIEPVLAHPRRIRNVCILAHVDHGKTTLTDSLLASNGIISFRQAGRLRYMDSREDEQQRGITMQASAITLLYDVPGDVGVSPMRHAINLIDSPGHVDFSRQVVTATRLCDGCLVLVDAVEGVCTQTMAVLRQAKRERLAPVLVVNKIDRLVTELRMDTVAAAEWLFRLVEQVNALYATLRMTDGEDGSGTSGDDNSGIFDPVRGNVVFASATDGWAFTVDSFARMFAERLQVSLEVLRAGLWGHYALDRSSRTVVECGPRGSDSRRKPMFAVLALDSVWAVYEATVVAYDEARVQRISQQTGANVPLRELRSRDGAVVLRTIMGQWLPLAETVFRAVVDHTPDPVQASLTRVAALAPAGHPLLDVEAAGDLSADPSVAFVSKLFSVTMMVVHNRPDSEDAREEPDSALDGDAAQSSSADKGVERITAAMFALDAHPTERVERVFGMARLFRGTLRIGQKMYIVRPQTLPDGNARALGIGADAHSQTHSQYSSETHEAFPFVLDELYLLMGREMEPVAQVHAGAIFGIGGAALGMLRSNEKAVTLSSSPSCPPLGSPHTEAAPIVRVAVRPKCLEDLSCLVEGLEMLCRVDPCAETFLQEENGEHILAAAGELHLEQCLKDLRERYVPCAPSAIGRAAPGAVDLVVSPPMVPYRETLNTDGRRAIVEDTWRDLLAAYGSPCDAASDAGGLRTSDGLLCVCTPDGRWRVGARALPVIPEIMAVLQRHAHALPAGLLGSTSAECALASELADVLPTLPEPWSRLSPRNFWGVGPRHAPDALNLLLSLLPVSGDSGPFHVPDGAGRSLASAIWAAFELAADKGPMANEPMHGVAFVVEVLELLDIQEECGHSASGAADAAQLIPTCRALFEAAFSFWSPRLMLAVYRCAVQTSAEMMGRVYAALAKRRGTVLSDEYHEGTRFFTIHALLPVEESFGFADDLRSRTAGVAIPQLVFGGFSVLDEDPYWMPQTEEEVEEHGALDERPAANTAMRYLVRIRERKGLFVERKVVQFAEKQRTLRR